MRGTDISTVPASDVAEKEILAAKQKLNRLEPARHGADVGAWISYSKGEAALDFRVPHADHKHPSSIPLDIHATDNSTVFSPGKYSAIRFETLEKRSPTQEKVERLYGNAEQQSSRELQEKHDAVIRERESMFERIVHEVAARHSGIRTTTDTGDGAFSGNAHRPHVRLRSIQTGGTQLASFVQTLCEQLEDYYRDLPHDRFVRR